MDLDPASGSYSFPCRSALRSPPPRASRRSRRSARGPRGRCSGRYVITAAQLEEGYDTVCCGSCSLYVRVLYDVVDEDGDA